MSHKILIKESESDSTLKDFFVSILRSIQIVLPSMDDVLLAKYAQELLSNLLAIYEKTFDSLAAEMITTVTTLLQSRG